MKRFFVALLFCFVLFNIQNANAQFGIGQPPVEEESSPPEEASPCEFEEQFAMGCTAIELNGPGYEESYIIDSIGDERCAMEAPRNEGSGTEEHPFLKVTLSDDGNDKYIKITWSETLAQNIRGDILLSYYQFNENIHCHRDPSAWGRGARSIQTVGFFGDYMV